MARGVLRGPHLAVRVLAVGVLPHVGDAERARKLAPADLVAEEAVKARRRSGQDVGREHREAELLQLGRDIVTHAGIVVIGPAEEHDADAVLALERLQHAAALLAQPGPERGVMVPGRAAGALVLTS